MYASRHFKKKKKNNNNFYHSKMLPHSATRQTQSQTRFFKENIVFRKFFLNFIIFWGVFLKFFSSPHIKKIRCHSGHRGHCDHIWPHKKNTYKYNLERDFKFFFGFLVFQFFIDF